MRSYNKCICRGDLAPPSPPSPPAMLVYYMMWGDQEITGSIGGFGPAEVQQVLDAVAIACPVPNAPGLPPYPPGSAPLPPCSG